MLWYRRNPDAALNGMRELTLEQIGAYNLILDLLYSRDGVVPDDDMRVARMINVHWRSWRALKLQLIAAGKIWVTIDGMLTAKRVSDTLMEASRVSQEQRRRVSKRWQEYRNAKQINGTAIRPGNTSTVTVTKSEIPSSLEDSDDALVDNGENFGAVKPRATIASGELAHLVRAKGWK